MNPHPNYVCSLLEAFPQVKHVLATMLSKVRKLDVVSFKAVFNKYTSLIMTTAIIYYIFIYFYTKGVYTHEDTMSEV